LRFVEMESRNGDPTARRHLANGELRRHPDMLVFCHFLFLLTSTLLEVLVWMQEAQEGAT
jgi:hypothetical protein